MEYVVDGVCRLCGGRGEVTAYSLHPNTCVYLFTPPQGVQAFPNHLRSLFNVIRPAERAAQVRTFTDSIARYPTHDETTDATCTRTQKR